MRTALSAARGPSPYRFLLSNSYFLLFFDHLWCQGGELRFSFFSANLLWAHEDEFHHLLAGIAQALAHHSPAVRRRPVGGRFFVGIEGGATGRGFHFVFAYAKESVRKDGALPGGVAHETEMAERKRQALRRAITAHAVIGELAPTDIRQANIRAMRARAQNRRGARMPPEKKQETIRMLFESGRRFCFRHRKWIRNSPGDFPAFVKAQRAFHFLADVNLMERGSLFRPASYPRNARNHLAFVRPIPKLSAELDSKKPGEGK